MPRRTAMRWRRLHLWDVTQEEGERIQRSIARIGASQPAAPLGTLARIAGAALSSAAAAVVVLEAGGWEVVEASRVELSEPGSDALRYRRGLMAFAFGPPLLEAFEQIESKPQVVIFRAHGIAHPRQCGMAAHLGLLLDVPSVGCADALLCGRCSPPGPERGEWTMVTDGAESLGACVRTRAGSRPLFVSPGYGVSIEDAVRVALLCTLAQHRLPEPLRQARLVTRQA